MKEKPRSASSSCIEETPRSSTTPVDSADRFVCGDVLHLAEAARGR